MTSVTKASSANATLKKGEWTDAALKVLKERYLHRRADGSQETPEEMVWRVAWAIAQAEREFGAGDAEIQSVAEGFYDLLIQRKFIPNSPTLMNAGLGNHLQYSACYVLPVEDSIEGIFESIRHAAIVHQSGGGCVAADSYVYTTFCGIEHIQTLYERVRATGRSERAEAGHAWMDVTDLGIRTLAMDPDTGRLVPRQVTHLWRWQVPAEQQVTVRAGEGLAVTTSAWHPFLAFTGRSIEERRADELKPGDMILTANTSTHESWPFIEYQELDGLCLDEELAWLAGYFLGCGSLDVFHNRAANDAAWRLRLFDGRPESIQHAARVLARFGIQATPQQDDRGLWRVTTTNQVFVRAFARLVEVEPGPQTDLTLPAPVAKSPLPVIGAFLAGLIDSDGYVSLERRCVSVTTACPSLAEKLLALASALGLEPAMQAKAPDARGRPTTYAVQLARSKKTHLLARVALPFMHDAFKRERIEQLTAPAEQDTLRRLPIPFAAIEEVLNAVGVDMPARAPRKTPVEIGGERFWLHRWRRETGIGAGRLRRLVRALKRVAPEPYHARLELLERAADGCAVVESVSRPDRPAAFYDFTVDGYNNYLAGSGQLAVVHNTGFAFSRLRPNGNRVQTSGGVASGPVSFMKVFDSATEAIKQGGRRRGANMGILRVDHPDIEEFITCKLDGSITNFNISVAATDAFMEALEKGADYDLIAQPGWPAPDGARYRGGEAMGKKNAREIFDQIVKAAWQTGDPGLVFIDRVNDSPANPTPEVGMIEATNPCVAGDTLIFTENGLVEARTLYHRGEPVRVAADGRRSPAAYQDASPVFPTGRKPVYRLRTREGYSLRLTADHRVMTERGWVQAGDLRPGDRLHVLNRKGGFGGFGGRELGLALGWLVGDGTIKEDRAALSFFGEEKRELAPMYADIVERLVDGMQQLQRRYPVGVADVPGRDEARVGSLRLKTLAAGYGLTAEAKHQAPGEVLAGTEAMQRGFLQALFTADGTVTGTPAKGLSVRLAQNDAGLLEQVQVLLLNFGIASRIYRDRRRAGYRAMPDAERAPAAYWCRAQHELVIGKANLLAFQREIGFLTRDKQARLAEGLAGLEKRGPYRETFTARFESLEADGVEEVYDLVEPETHAFVANGLVVHNCGEQPLLPMEACNLGSIDLAKFVRRTGDNGADPIDWAGLEGAVRQAVRFLDDVITVNPYPLPQIDEAVKANRRIGLGVMGWADMLFELGVAYDSPEALSLAERVMGFINDIGHDEDANLAEARGPFPNWPRSIYRDGRPLRNSTVTTIAPTGSISIIAGTSSGIEPIFALAFRHVVKQGKGQERVLSFANSIFERVAKERGFWSEALMAEIARRGTCHGVEGVPADVQRVFVTAHEVEPEWHIRTQAAFQKATDNGVSKTINLPNEATLDDVARAYRLAYDTGCLGITVFRDGSKGEQVLNVGVNEAKSSHPSTPVPPSSLPKVTKPRPAILDGKTYRKNTPLGAAYITVNSNGEGEKEPFEVFVNIGKAGSDTTALAEALGRLISLVLRLPSPLSAFERVQDIAGQLRGIGSGRATGFGPQRVMSLPDAVAQVLAEHVGLRGTEPLPGLPELEHEPRQLKLFSGADLCPECGQATFVMEEGCKKCHACGFSEC